jgi:hypothetical protein
MFSSAECLSATHIVYGDAEILKRAFGCLLHIVQYTLCSLLVEIRIIFETNIYYFLLYPLIYNFDLC